jgi:hypothetical protein
MKIVVWLGLPLLQTLIAALLTIKRSTLNTAE